MIRPVRSSEPAQAGAPTAPIERAHVLNRIADAARFRIVLIVAPAGYGKSTALRQYLDLAPKPTIRFDIRPDNASLLGFIRGFARAISTIAPDAENTVAGAYESALSSPTPELDLANWLHAHILTFTGIIALDDVHIIEETPGASTLLASLIERTKSRIQWFLASRTTLDLPIGTWLAYQDMDLIIDDSHLSFTNDDARKAARGFEVRIHDDELSQLLELTAGWPIALTYALRTSMRVPDAMVVATATRDMVYRYLAEQVYRSLTETEQALLMASAALPEIDCDVLKQGGFPRAFATLDGLKTRGVFLFQTPENPRIFRFHDLFRDFLVRQMEVEGIDQTQSTAALAAALEQLNRIPEALRLFAKAHCYDDMERLLELHGLSLMEGTHGDTINYALDVLEKANHVEGSIAWALRGLLCARVGRFDEAEAALRRATKRSSDPELRAQLLLCRARIAVNSGAQPSELTSIEEDTDIALTTRAEAASISTVVFVRRGEDSEARAATERAIRALIDIVSPKTRARILQRVGVAEIELGDFDNATLHLEAAAELATEQGLLSLASRAHQNLCNVVWLTTNDQARYQWYAQQSTVTATKAGDRLDVQQAASKMLNAELRRGNLDRVLTIERNLTESRTSRSLEKTNLAESQAIRAAWAGRFSDAFELSAPVWSKVYFIGERAVCGAQCATYAAAAGHPEKASQIVTNVLSLLDDHKSDPLVQETNRSIATSFCALAEAINGRLTVATRIMKRPRLEAHQTARALHACVTQIIAAIKNRSLSPSEVEAQLAEMRRLGHTGWVMILQALIESKTGLKTNLTPSELDVLARLATGRKPKDIAQEENRPYGTVRKHADNAIAKLGCHSRAEAIALAQRMGLIPPQTPNL